MIRDLATTFSTDRRRYSLAAAGLRTLRASRAWMMRDLQERLAASPAMQGHLASFDQPDPLFYLSSRHFLAQGLSPRQRAEAAFCHYDHEDRAFAPAYHEKVYRSGGLVLWERVAEGVRYDIRLMPGNDALTEGGLSVVFFVDDVRMCVLSFSVVPTATVIPEPSAMGEAAAALGPTIPLVARRHTTRDRDWQNAFNKAFDRTTPSHLCFGAVSGLAVAQGHRLVMGIAAERHAYYSPANAEQFRTTYAEFWESLGARLVPPFGYVFDVPLQHKALDDMPAAKRKRALARRAHAEEVQRSAEAVIAAHLRPRDGEDGATHAGATAGMPLSA